MVLLRKLNNFLGKYMIPEEVMRKAERILYDKAIGKYGFIAIFLKPIKNDVVEILDILDCYPRTMEFTDYLTRIEIKDTKSWIVRGNDWYIDKMTIKGEDSCVWVFYYMRLKDIYK